MGGFVEGDEVGPGDGIVQAALATKPFQGRSGRTVLASKGHAVGCPASQGGDDSLASSHIVFPKTDGSAAGGSTANSPRGRRRACRSRSVGSLAIEEGRSAAKSAAFVEHPDQDAGPQD